MDEIEIQVFEEYNDYHEKIGIMTLRQWLFSALMLIIVIPTYILLPKYTFITSDMASYIVIIEAAIIGFIGFVKIHKLPAEKIIPYWYRHYFVFNKPLKYMTTKEYQKMLDDKKNKNKKSKVIEYDDDDLTPKQRKKKEKQEKELAKAKKKYGYMFKVDKNTSSIKDDAEQEETTASASEQLLNEENKGLQSEIKKEDVSIDEKTLETMTDEEKRMLAQILEKLKEK